MNQKLVSYLAFRDACPHMIVCMPLISEQHGEHRSKQKKEEKERERN